MKSDKKGIYRLLCMSCTVCSLAVLLRMDSVTASQPTAQYALWAIAAFLLFHRLRSLRNTPTQRSIAEAWLWLVAAAILAAWMLYADPATDLIHAVILFPLGMACVTFFAGKSFRRELSLPLIVLLVVIPSMPILLPWISLPMRMLSSRIAVSLICLTGESATCSGTEISAGMHSVAITAACSGLTFLSTMLWVGWLVVLQKQPQGLLRLFHFSLLIPLVILGNALRIVLLFVGYQHCGETFIIGSTHRYTGYVAVALAFILFLIIEQLSDRQESPRTKSSDA